MNARRILALGAYGVAFVVVVALFAGQLLGQPVLLSYATSASMAPTIQPGDGFLVLPVELTGGVEPGDVVVFHAEELHDGGLTTHRVVEDTPRGYVTKGDANPFTDQADDEPPVKSGQVVGEVVQVGGSVLTVPHLGDLVTGLQGLLREGQSALVGLLGARARLGTRGLAGLLFVAGVLSFAVSVVRDRRGTSTPARSRTRTPATTSTQSTTSTTQVLVGLALLVVLSTTASMAVPAGVTEYSVISADTDDPGVRMIPEGGSEVTTYTVRNSGVLPVLVFLEPGSDGITVGSREVYVEGRDAKNATVRISVPDRNGHYRRYLVEHRYLGVLPRPTIRSLYAVHPWLPVVVVDLLAVAVFLAAAVPILGGFPGATSA